MQRFKWMPQISVLMGSHYQRRDVQLLERSIRSILGQSYQDFEFLICMDGSTDKAKHLVQQIAQSDRRIRLLPRGNRYSLPSKLNACLQQSQGKMIARMDDDDFSHSDRFEKQVSFLEDRPEIDFVGCNVELWEKNQPVGVRNLPLYPNVRDFLFVQPFIHPTLMFRREALLAANGYSEDKHCLKCEDYDLLLRLYELGFRGVNLQETLFDYTTSAKGNRKMTDRWNEAVTRYRHFEKLGLLPQAWPYVAKPVLVGLLPPHVLRRIKRIREHKRSQLK